MVADEARITGIIPVSIMRCRTSSLVKIYSSAPFEQVSLSLILVTMEPD
jgi:hypothetical protein